MMQHNRMKPSNRIFGLIKKKHIKQSYIVSTRTPHKTSLNILFSSRMAEEVGYLFNESVFSQFAAGCIIICITMFQLTLVKNTVALIKM